MAKQKWTEEEKAAKKIADIMSDMRIDAEQVGQALGTSTHVEILNRLVETVNAVYVSRENLRKRLGLPVEPIEFYPAISTISTASKNSDGTTVFRNKFKILSDFWIDFKHDEEHADLFIYNDLGFPLAFALNSELASMSENTESIINQTWEDFLNHMKVDDSGFKKLSEVLKKAGQLQ